MPAPIRLAYNAPGFDERHPAIVADLAQLQHFLGQSGYEASDHDLYQAYGDWSEENQAAGWYSVGDLARRTEHGRDGLLAGLLARLKPAEPSP